MGLSQVKVGEDRTKIGQVTWHGDTDELDRRAMAIIARAAKREGAKVFQCTRRAAAHHEASHAVVHALDGDQVRSVKVKLRHNPATGRHGWFGFTSAGQPWLVAEETSPDSDLCNARKLLSGIAGEVLFEGEDFALASSLDESLMVGQIVSVAAHKMRRPAEQLYMLLWITTLADLRLHQDQVKQIAGLLLRDRTVTGRRLAKLLPQPDPVRPGARTYPRDLLLEMRDVVHQVLDRYGFVGR